MSLDVVGSYWSGALERLQSEVNVMNELIAHSGTRGSENEAALTRMVRGLIPLKYGVGSGLVFDRNGNYSKQMDLIIYENFDAPTLLAQTNQVLFPIENVLLCIEIKTTVDGREIADAQAKRASLLALESGGITPKLALFGFRASQLAETIAAHLQKDQEASGPDFTCVASLGLIAGKGWTGEEKFEIGITPRTLPGGDFDLATEDDIGIAAVRGTRSFPIVQVADTDYVVDASRALLLFCELIMLSIGSEGANTLAAYIRAELRAAVPISGEETPETE